MSTQSSNSNPESSENDEPDPIINPYAAPAVLADSADLMTAKPAPVDDYVLLTLTQTIRRWVLVCCLSAIPSFLMGLLVSGGQIVAMLLGILIFSAIYTVADFHTAPKSWRKNKLVRRTLRFSYGTRIAISIIIPIGYLVDVATGASSIGLTQALVSEDFMSGIDDGTPSGFAAILLLTLVQGAMMNIVLGVYAAVVFFVVWISDRMTR